MVDFTAIVFGGLIHLFIMILKVLDHLTVLDIGSLRAAIVQFLSLAHFDSHDPLTQPHVPHASFLALRPLIIFAWPLLISPTHFCGVSSSTYNVLGEIDISGSILPTALIVTLW